MRFRGVYDTRVLGGLQDAMLDSFLVNVWNDTYWFRFRIKMRLGKHARRTKWCIGCIKGKKHYHSCWRDTFCVLDNLFPRLVKPLKLKP